MVTFVKQLKHFNASYVSFKDQICTWKSRPWTALHVQKQTKLLTNKFKEHYSVVYGSYGSNHCELPLHVCKSMQKHSDLSAAVPINL